MVDVKANGYIYNPINDELTIIRFVLSMTSSFKKFSDVII